MFKSSMLFYAVLTVGLFAGENQIEITGVVQANAQTQMKVTSVYGATIEQDILVQTNHRGLTLSLANAPLSNVLLNQHAMGTAPLDFSSDVHAKPTKVGELIISQKESNPLNAVALIVSIK